MMFLVSIILVLLLIEYKNAVVRLAFNHHSVTFHLGAVLFPVIALTVLWSAVTLVWTFLKYTFGRWQQYMKYRPLGQTINYAVGHYVKSKYTYSINDSGLDSEGKFLVNALRLACGEQFTAIEPEYPNSEYANTLKDYQNSIQRDHYVRCIECLEFLEGRFGLTEWIYIEMRKCLINGKQYRKLQMLNRRAPAEFQKYLSEYGPNEWVAFDMLNQCSMLDEPKDKISVLMTIANNNALNQRLLFDLISLLEYEQRYDEIMNLIESQWSKFPSVTLARHWLVAIRNKGKSPTEISNTIFSKFRDLGNPGTRFLIYTICLETGNISGATNIINKIEPENQNLAALLKIKLAKYQNQDLESVNLDFDPWEA